MKTKWEEDFVNKEDCIELWSVREYNEKLLTVELIYKDDFEGVAEAKIKTTITSPEKENGNDIEHFEQRCYVGFNDKLFYQKMLDKVKCRHLKLERIASGKDE